MPDTIVGVLRRLLDSPAQVGYTSIPMTVSLRRLLLSTARIACVLALIVSTTSLVPLHAALRPGAVRTIQIRWGEPFPGALMSADIGKLSITRAVFGGAQQPGVLQSSGPDSWRLFFTVEANGTRNLWQAVPELSRADATTNAEGTSMVPNLRNVVWRATPLTRFSVPFYADEAAPTPDGRSLLLVTNADLRSSDRPHTLPSSQATEGRQIARLDLVTGRLSAVTTSSGRHSAPSVAPNGQHFAYGSDRSGMESVYIMPLGGGTARRVATLARNPMWLDDRTLLFESTRPGQSGLYQLSLGRALTNDNAWSSLPRARQLFSRAGEVAVTQDGRLLCVAANVGNGPESADGERQLIMLAPDGSGARSVIGTAGARWPSFAPDGQLLVFDAPAPEDAPPAPITTGAVESRTLWLMPMLRINPTAQLTEVRPLVRNGQETGEIDVLGTAFAEEVGPLEARLEYSPAGEPQRWRPLTVNRPPIHNGILATWKPEAPGDWLLRLTVTDAAGDSAQATLPLTWPLPLPVVQAPPPSIFPAPNPDDLLPAEPPTPPAVVEAPRPIPALPLPALPPAPTAGATTTPAIKATPTPTRQPRVPKGTQVPMLPLPALPAPPGNTPYTAPPATPTPVPRPTNRPATPAVPSFPEPSVSPLPPASIPPVPVPPPVATPRPVPPRSTPTPAPTAPVSRPTPAAPSAPAGTDRGIIRVSGTPSVINVGARVPVEAVLTNGGRQGWSSQGSNPVRLIYHWVNIDTGTRVRWYIEWLTQPVAPGASLRLSFNLSAPPRAGRYRLTYTLVRLQGETYEPPAYNARPARWPGEFGATSYVVTVR